MSHFKEKVSELLCAIDQELSAVSARETCLCVLVNGRKQMVGGTTVYIFQLAKEKQLHLVEEELSLRIGLVSHPVALVRHNQNELELLCSADLGPEVPKAELCLRSGAILSALRHSLEANTLIESSARIALELFAAKSVRISTEQRTPVYTFAPDNSPNQSQRNAILNSFDNSVSLIWGPPGTGKTKTIAQAVEAHLNAGRRVLLLSNANAAVDVALSGVANHLKKSYYQDGTLLRLGGGKNEVLAKTLPLVLPSEMARIENAKLESRVGKYMDEIGKVQCSISIAADYLECSSKIVDIRAKIRTIETRVPLLHGERARFVSEYNQLLETYELVSPQTAPANGLSPATRSNDCAEAMDSLRQEMERRIAAATEVDEECKGLYVEHSTLISSLGNVSGAQFEMVEKLKLQMRGAATAFSKLSVSAVRDFTLRKRESLLKLQNELAKFLEEETFTEADAVARARVVATTLAKMCFYSKSRFDFDIVIVDEASMASPALLFWAATFAKKGITLVGDFKQLPPVSSAETQSARKWFRKSIFDLLKISDAKSAMANPLVTMLDTQYRMNPSIAKICNDMCYGGNLRNGDKTHELRLAESLGGDNCLVLIDTSKLNAFCSPGKVNSHSSGRINVIESLLCRYLVAQLSLSLSLDNVGITSPYRAQANLITELTRDLDCENRLLTNTVHKFQGGEKDVMIFSAVEGPGRDFHTGMLNDKKKDSTAEVLLNVAVSRTRKKLFLLANVDFLRNRAAKGALILQVVSAFQNNGVVISADELPFVSAMKGMALDVQNAKPDSSAFRVSQLRFYDEVAFWPAFHNDLRGCKQRLDLVTGFVGRLRSEQILPVLKQLRERGVEVSLFTRPAESHGSISQDAVACVFAALKDIGVKISLLNEAHQKAAIIDGRIGWQGSLNIMSHQTAHEQMIRFENAADVQSMLSCLKLQEFAKT